MCFMYVTKEDMHFASDKESAIDGRGSQRIRKRQGEVDLYFFHVRDTLYIIAFTFDSM